MGNQDLLFYEEYEQFYKMAESSKAFRDFCRDAFGEDFSQDGFSDLAQIHRILDFIPTETDTHILDIGCGNGKMLGYLQEKTNALQEKTNTLQKTNVFIHGFDYSGAAIEQAKRLFPTKAEFIQGNMGEVDYPKEQFDVMTSMDTMYFAPDMKAFLLQIMGWLKKDGVLFVCYQEGDVMPKTENAETTVLAKALKECGIPYTVEDITKDTYALLRKKRETALRYEQDFAEEGNKEWFELLMLQTDCVTEGYESFAQQMARYVYVVRRYLRNYGDTSWNID